MHEPSQTAPTLMRREIAEIPDAIERLLGGARPAIEAAGAMLRRLDPPVIASFARGSSDHAASCFKTACEIMTGLPVASIGPSIASVYATPLRLAGAAGLTISQSGRSPDLIAALKAARAGGARTIAFINAPDTPLAAVVDHAIPLRAGEERSIAATKSFVASVVGGLALLAAWREDAALWAALERLPGLLRGAGAPDWSAAMGAIVPAASLYVLGRGPGFTMALEAALKFKETCALHAEAFSAAEVQHGPMSLVQSGFPVLAFLQDDAALPGLRQTLARLAEQGGRVFVAGGEAPGATSLPVPETGHPMTQAIAAICAFYAFVEQVSRARGLAPDHPPHLRKVTETL